MKKLHLLFADIRHMNKYIIAATAVFIAGFFLGINEHDRFADFLNQQLKGLEQIASSIKGKSHPQLWLFWLIFWNNIRTSIMAVYLGLIFGVLPIAILLINGMILGYIGVDQAAGQSWWYVAKGIIPHGIIELPAVILACAYGIRLGFIVLKSIAALFVPEWRARVQAEMRHVLKLTVPLAGVLIVALLIAALIESTFTYWIVKS